MEKIAKERLLSFRMGIFLLKKTPLRVRKVAQKRHCNFYVFSIPQTIEESCIEHSQQLSFTVVAHMAILCNFYLSH